MVFRNPRCLAWHKHKNKHTKVYFYLPANTCALMCAGDKRTGYVCGVLTWIVSNNNRAATYPIPRVSASPLLPTPLWLIRNVSGISPSAGRGRGRKYLQSSQEGTSLGVALWWVDLLSLRASTKWEYSKGWPLMSSHAGYAPPWQQQCRRRAQETRCSLDSGKAKQSTCCNGN